MFGSTIVDVAIGLVFVFFLLSTVTSHINDLISSWMQWRVKDLENGVRQLLGDPDLANKVWNHPLIQGVSGRRGKAPDYIPPNTFALALFDAILPGANHPSAGQALRAQMMTLPESSARRAVVSMIDAANANMADARSEVEGWFNAAMDRVSAEYKRRMQVLTLLVATLVTLIFGADTLAIANSLWQEPSLRAAVAGAAATSQVVAAGVPQTTTNLSPVQNGTFQEAVKTISQSSLPIGWTHLPDNALGWVQKFIGLVLTILATSLGAPFWYQLLKSLSSIRSPATTSDQKT